MDYRHRLIVNIAKLTSILSWMESKKINDNSFPSGKITNLQLSLDSKATIISPSFIGIPTAPTTANSNKTTQLATTEFVHNMI
jgi:hypothetical protein